MKTQTAIAALSLVLFGAACDDVPDCRLEGTYPSLGGLMESVDEVEKYCTWAEQTLEAESRSIGYGGEVCSMPTGMTCSVCRPSPPGSDYWGDCSFGGLKLSCDALKGTSREETHELLGYLFEDTYRPDGFVTCSLDPYGRPNLDNICLLPSGYLPPDVELKSVEDATDACSKAWQAIRPEAHPESLRCTPTVGLTCSGGFELNCYYIAPESGASDGTKETNRAMLDKILAQGGVCRLQP